MTETFQYKGNSLAISMAELREHQHTISKKDIQTFAACTHCRVWEALVVGLTGFIEGKPVSSDDTPEVVSRLSDLEVIEKWAGLGGGS